MSICYIIYYTILHSEGHEDNNKPHLYILLLYCRSTEIPRLNPDTLYFVFEV